MKHLTNKQLEEINNSFDWKTKCSLVGKGKKVDFKGYADIIKHMVNPTTKCLELGCNEGYHTIELAKIFKHVTAIDIKPKNIMGALIRQWIHGCSNIDFRLLDLNKKIMGKYDMTFSSNVLYHMKNPCQHLWDIAKITDSLLLITNTFSPKGKRPYLGETEIGRYIFHKVGEKKTEFSGITDYALWFDNENDVIKYLKYIGFKTVKLLKKVKHGGYPKSTIFASKNILPK